MSSSTAISPAIPELSSTSRILGQYRGQNQPMRINITHLQGQERIRIAWKLKALGAIIFNHPYLEADVVLVPRRWSNDGQEPLQQHLIPLVWEDWVDHIELAHAFDKDDKTWGGYKVSKAGWLGAVHLLDKMPTKGLGIDDANIGSPIETRPYSMPAESPSVTSSPEADRSLSGIGSLAMSRTKGKGKKKESSAVGTSNRTYKALDRDPKETYRFESLSFEMGELVKEMRKPGALDKKALKKAKVVVSTGLTGLLDEDLALLLGKVEFTTSNVQARLRSLLNPGVVIPPPFEEIHAKATEFLEALDTAKASLKALKGKGKGKET